MFSSDKFKNAVVHSLRVDADSVNAVFLHNFKLFRRNRVRSACFNGKFPDSAEIKRVSCRAQNSVKLFRSEHSRSSSAHINRFKAKPKFSHEHGGIPQFFTKQINVLRYKLRGFFYCVRSERTIGTSARTERNRNIHAHGFRF